MGFIIEEIETVEAKEKKKSRSRAFLLEASIFLSENFPKVFDLKDGVGVSLG